MGMPEEKKRINAVIDMDMYITIMGLGYGISEAVIRGFKKLLEEKEGTNHKEDSLKSNDGLVPALENRIASLEEQLKTKDQQLEKKDTQIENLTKAMQSQAINIHDMLNQKTIEAPRAKKKWWKIF